MQGPMQVMKSLNFARRGITLGYVIIAVGKMTVMYGMSCRKFKEL